ncbi:alpha/beta hydrolase [Pseudonocardia ailaonensis]|uniref:Alpha/beta hydrolase n=1 Tax=Pseudonocardia ailaonensis TaxID=367279 RepID=A0ABN2MTC3_9PSEU
MTTSLQHVTSADGTRIAVRRVGTGRPLVVLPGAMNGIDSWSAVAAELDGFEVWLVARRGYPPSDEGPGEKSFAAETADVRALVEAADRGDGVHLAGHSYGALLALHTALADPSRLRSLLLYEPPVLAIGDHLPQALADYRARLAAGSPEGAIMGFLTEVAGVTPQVMAALQEQAGEIDPDDDLEPGEFVTGVLHDLEALAGAWPGAAHFADVGVPTLLMAGADSWDPLPASADALERVLPDVRRVTWPGQSHFANMADPALVARTIRDFVGPDR